MFKAWKSTVIMALAAIAGIHAQAAVSVGDKAPDFTLRDQNGKQVALSELSDKIVVLEWTNPDCPFVQRHYKQKTMKTLAEKYADQEVVWLAINSSHYADQAFNATWAREQHLSYSVLDDHRGEVGRAYSAKTTPHMFVIQHGSIKYMGAIDDDPRGKTGADATNYVEAAVDALIADQAIEVSSTKPYGCSVKYK